MIDKKSKYADIDSLMGEVDEALDIEIKPTRTKRATPALASLTGENKLLSGVEREKRKSEEEINRVKTLAEAEKSLLLDQLEAARSKVGEGTPVVLTMPVTKHKVSFELLVIDPDLIDVSPENERAQNLLDVVSLNDILPDIIKHGQQRPGTVRPKGNGRYELIEGSRRKAAVKLAGMQYLAFCGDVPDADVRALSVIENKHKDVSPYEKALAYKRQIDNKEYTNWTQLAAAKGFSTSHASRFKTLSELDAKFVRILRCPSDMTANYGETISSLVKKSKSDLEAKVSELLELRQSTDAQEGEYPEFDEIVKILKSAVRSRIEKPTTSKPITYKTPNGEVEIKHSITPKGVTKFELNGATEKQLNNILRAFSKEFNLKL